MNVGSKNIRAVDLNLLVAFDAMMTERNVTKAAARIGLAQPSMSNALSRLRGLMDDELFVRAPGVMVPTGLAEQMAPHVRAALDSAERAVNAGYQFEPSSAKADLTLATTDTFDFIFIPDLIEKLSGAAPGINIRTQNFDRQTYEDLLDRQVVDLAIGVAPQIPKRLRAETLYAEEFVCIARKGHPLIKGALDLETFLAADHALYSLRGDGRGIVDRVLEQGSMKRRVVTSTASYTAIPTLVASSDLIAVVAKRMAVRAAKFLPIELHAVPFALPKFEVDLIWSLSTDRDPLQIWVRELMRGLA